MRSRYRFSGKGCSLERRFSFRSFRGGETTRAREEEKRKGRKNEERERERRAENGKEIQALVSTEVSFRRETFLWIRIEVPPSDYAPYPPSLSAIIVPHRIHVAPFFPPPFSPSPTLLSTAATTTRRKPIRDRHPAERQRLLVYPRSHVKMGSRSSVTQTETECNEAVYGRRWYAVSTTFRPEPVCIRFGIYFIYHSRLSPRGLRGPCAISLADTLIQ